MNAKSRLRSLLVNSSFEAPTLEFINATEQILRDNQMPFFPAYTDHGIAHVDSVLTAAERLIPEDVWRLELLGPADASALICATHLHDLGLHLREQGFIALISEPTPFKPLPWFDHDQRNRTADLPWPRLWENFRREARHFNQSQLDRILGRAHIKTPTVAYSDSSNEASWNLSDKLLIGEFIRRHHARLSHEIAIYGFPGTPPEYFPVLSDTLPTLADSIGTISRSHNEDLRVILDYLDDRAPGDQRPDGVLAPYLMGLLRVADYFQIEAGRASPLLLHLRNPQSPQSLAEWTVNQAVPGISWEHKDPLAFNIHISPTHGVRTYLQLTELMDNLQQELDTTVAVLSEVYGISELAPLRLSRQRVRTNLHTSNLCNRLPFVPRSAKLRSAEDLFRLVISDLYGDQPSVAGRELLQNAVDAVRELRHWSHTTRQDVNPTAFYDLPNGADVLIELDVCSNEQNILRVIDHGIGMSPDTVINGFLTAGATFSPTHERSVNHDDFEPDASIKWMKAGRFGIGAFAAFLLGSTVEVTTRHIDSSRGVSFVACLDDDLIQLDWVDDCPFGTKVKISFPNSALPQERYRELDIPERRELLLRQIDRCYQLVDPVVQLHQVDADRAVSSYATRGEIPAPDRRLPDTWRKVRTSDFDAVLWCLPGRLSVLSQSHRGGRVAHNGLVINDPTDTIFSEDSYQWSDSEIENLLGHPGVAVFDTQHRLGLSLTRYKLTEPGLPFETQLLRSIGADVVARALVLGEGTHPLGNGLGLRPIVSRQHWIPFFPGLVERYVDRDLCVLWNPESGPFVHEHSPFMRGHIRAASWRKFPFRATFNLDRRDKHPDTEEEYLRHLRGALQRAIQDFRDFVSFKPVASVFMYAPSLMGRGGYWTAQPRWSMDVSEEPGDPCIGWSDGDPELIQALIESGSEILSQNDLGSVGLTIFRRDGGSSDTKANPIVKQWVDYIGGPLERPLGARLAHREEILTDRRLLRTLVNKWTRLAERDQAYHA